MRPSAKSTKEAERKDFEQLEDIFAEMEQDEGSILRVFNFQTNKIKEAMIAMQNVSRLE